MSDKAPFVLGALFIILGNVQIFASDQPLIGLAFLAVGVLWLVSGWRQARKKTTKDNTHHP